METKTKNSSMEVSIIIVNYNSTQLLKNCVDSLIENTKNLKYEIIVIDNNSIVGNVEDVLKCYDGVVLIKNNINKGFGRANNQGAKIAKGKYLLFLNNDTIFYENTIKKIFDFAESAKKDSIISCRLLNGDKSLQKSIYDFPSLFNVFSSNFFLYLLFPKSKLFNKYHLINKTINSSNEVDVVTGAFLFIRWETFKQLNGFDETFFFYMEDTDICYRHKMNNGNVIYFPETSIVHLKGRSAKGESWFKNKYQSISTIQYFQKHFKGVKYFLMILFHFVGLLLRVPIFLISGIITLNSDLIKRSAFNLRLLFIYPSKLIDN